MGVSRSPRDLSRKLYVTAGAIEKVEKAGLRKAAGVVRTSVNRQVASVAPGRRMRGVGRSGARVGAATSVRGNVAVIFARGPLHLLERPTAPHEIKPKRKQAVMTPYGPKARVNHPGTRGKYPWRKGVAKARPLIPQAFADGLRRELAKVFG